MCQYVVNIVSDLIHIIWFWKPVIQNNLGLDNGSNGDISLTCGNPAEPTTSTTTIIESSRTYIVSSEANYYNNNDDVKTINSLVTTSSVDSTFKESSNADSDKQICNCFFLSIWNFIVNNTNLVLRENDNDALITIFDLCAFQRENMIIYLPAIVQFAYVRKSWLNGKL